MEYCESTTRLATFEGPTSQWDLAAPRLSSSVETAACILFCTLLVCLETVRVLIASIHTPTVCTASSSSCVLKEQTSRSVTYDSYNDT